jgi:hypothetical protein
MIMFFPSHMWVLFFLFSFWFFFTKATNSRRFGSDKIENPNYTREAVNFFSQSKMKLTRSWPLDRRGCFGQRIKWDACFSFGLWAWPLEASHYGHPSQEAMGVHGQKVWTLEFGLWRLHIVSGWRLQFLYFVGYVFAAHFFGLSTKFGHSIMRPLNLDSHSVKRP